MRKLLSTFYIVFSVLTGFTQSIYTLNGYVRDSQNGEELIGVTVYVSEINNGVVTNPYGFYSISLPEGQYTITFGYLGYKNQVKSISLNENVAQNIDLISESLELEEVVISDVTPDINVQEVVMSRHELKIDQLKKLPTFFGESDLIKTIQMLPGVISAGEGTSAFFVRGGSADQNLIQIDEAPIYDPSHLFGLFSVFNSDVIKDIELYKGGIPPQFGGRLSSILDVRTKDGNNKEISGSGGIGTLASRFMLEGPIRKDRSSFLVSGRRSYADLFLAIAGEENRVSFYDVNLKVNWRANNNNRFFVAGYVGNDAFRSDNDFRFNWGNKTVTFRWNHLFNEKLFSNTSLIASQFDYGLEILDPVEGLEWTADIQQYTFKQDFNYFLNPNNELNFGYHLSYQRFAPGKIQPNAEGSIFASTELENLYALDHALYIGNNQTITKRLSIQYGVRLSLYQNVGNSTILTYRDPRDNINIDVVDTTNYSTLETIKTFINPEPRASARYLLNRQSSLKVSYNRTVQNVHLISSGTVPLPFNTWQPSSPYLDPQKSDQWALGYFRNIKDNEYELSIEGYYKDMFRVTDFADNANIFFNEHLPTEFRQGKSWSYGIEMLAVKTKGKLTGFASYTWSKTEREVPEVNNSEAFLANYDRRNTLNIVSTYDHTEKWSFGANFTYSSGRPMTLPAGRYEYRQYQPDFYIERNGYRMPDFHRLDVSATLYPLKNKNRKWKASWVFSISNLYNRKNPFTIFTESDGQGGKTAKMVYLFPILPSVTYNFKF